MLSKGPSQQHNFIVFFAARHSFGILCGACETHRPSYSICVQARHQAHSKLEQKVAEIDAGASDFGSKVISV